MPDKSNKTMKPASGAPNDYVYYQNFGAKLSLPEKYQASRQPDWRLAHFAVILPFPFAYAKDPGESWIKGRFKGIKEIIAAAEVNPGDFQYPRFEYKTGAETETERQARYDRNSAQFFNRTPRAWHAPASSRFKFPFRQSIGSVAVDGPACEQIEGKVDNAEKLEATAYKYLFSPDITGDAKKPDACASSDLRQDCLENQPSVESEVIKLADDDDHPYSQLRLACAELLSYQGPEYHPLARDKETEKVAQTFLVLHVIAENCSSKVLENVSRALYRPRNVVNLAAESSAKFGGQKASKRIVKLNENQLCPLDYFTRTALSKIVDFDKNVHISRGGYLAHKRDENENSTEYEIAARPYLVTCAIPGGNAVSDSPELLRKTSGQWEWEDQWAWQLSTGADGFFSPIPEQNDETLSRHRAGIFKNWIIHTSENGLAVVRRCQVSREDMGFWMLTGTRYVDLAVLVRREAKFAETISAGLRAMEFDETINTSADRGSLDDANDRYRESVRKFEHLQQDFLTYRDYLWFDNVPARETDTLVLNAIQKSTGTKKHYEEIANELSTRREYYSTMYENLRMRLDEKNKQRKKAEQEAAAKRTAAITNSFAFLAIVFALPGIVALTEWWRFWITVGLVLIFVAGVFLYLRKNSVVTTVRNGASEERSSSTTADE